MKSKSRGLEKYCTVEVTVIGGTTVTSFIHCHSVVSFCEQVLPQVLESAMENDVEFRRGLPRNYLEFLGTCHADSVCDGPAWFCCGVYSVVC